MNKEKYGKFFRRLRRASFTCLVAILASPAVAQQPNQVQANAIKQACRADFQKNCAGVPAGGSAALVCLQTHAANLSSDCQNALLSANGQSEPENQQAITMLSAETWPQNVTGEGGSAVVYQPQVISWPDRQKLITRIALSLSPKDAEQPVLGTIEVSFATSTDLTTRWVTLSSASLIKSNFPAADTEQAARFENSIRAGLAALDLKRIPLDTLLLSLRDNSETPASVPLHNKPPQIFYSQSPASLLVFDGEPVMTPVAETGLTMAVNTNWNVFFESGSKTWFWLNNDFWLRADDVKGDWSPAGALPAAFSQLPDDGNYTDVKKNIPSRSITAAEVPAVFVSTSAAEIIVTQGAPQYTAIEGTSLEYVDNTDAALFRDTSSRKFYYLVSGRWFSAPGIMGPWAFATTSLPTDFALIPADGPRGFVLVSVPGTVQAQEALILAQIPQQATLEITSATLEVDYAGEPEFKPIEGTSLAYAVNTSFNVVQVQNTYFACYQGAWFFANSPAGAWALAISVPAVIYTIPPASPLYPCTYVRVYTSTPTTVTYGYTAGYTMGYISAGVIVYGTGYYYPPYIYPAPIPIFYPWPVTYAGATYYNPATGAWAHGGAIYGPFYGARGGSAYNPTTGAYARGGSVYGPYGGAGAFSAYNPTTGSYAHGSAVWGPDGAAANASWYNARTGISGSTNQNSNAYGHWGSSTISGPNQTVHTQSQGDSRGSVGSFTSSSGAEGAGFKGAGGNSGGAVKTANDNVYAGADGNVYKKTDDGWEKYDSGSWNPVDKPSPQKSENQRPGQSDLSGATKPQRPAAGVATSGRQQKINQNTQSGTSANSAATGRFQGRGTTAQLDQDHQSRLGGAQRQQQFGASRAGRGGRARN